MNRTEKYIDEGEMFAAKRMYLDCAHSYRKAINSFRTLYEKEKEKLSLCMETLEFYAYKAPWAAMIDDEYTDEQFGEKARDTLSKLKDGE